MHVSCLGFQAGQCFGPSREGRLALPGNGGTRCRRPRHPGLSPSLRCACCLIKKYLNRMNEPKQGLAPPDSCGRKPPGRSLQDVCRYNGVCRGGSGGRPCNGNQCDIRHGRPCSGFRAEFFARYTKQAFPGRCGAMRARRPGRSLRRCRGARGWASRDIIYVLFVET